MKAAYLTFHGRATIYDGVPLVFPANLGDGLLWSICRYGTGGFEPDTWATLRRLAVDAKVFLDIGSNIGFYSVLVRKVAPHVEVIGFEPLPTLHDAYRQFCKINGVTVEFVPHALGDTNGMATLYVPTGDEGKSTATISAVSWQAREPHNEISVHTISLDAYLAGRSLKTPIVIKIDVEDHEAAVLRGAIETINRYRPAIVCEILPRPLLDPNDSNEKPPIAEQHENSATVAVIEELGYVAFAIKRGGYCRFSAKDFARPRAFTDFLLIPREQVNTRAMEILLNPNSST